MIFEMFVMISNEFYLEYIIFDVYNLSNIWIFLKTVLHLFT